MASTSAIKKKKCAGAHRVTQNYVAEGGVSCTDVRRKRFRNAVPACVFLRKSFQNGVPMRSITKILLASTAIQESWLPNLTLDSSRLTGVSFSSTSVA
jgi:hypothetical protein